MSYQLDLEKPNQMCGNSQSDWTMSAKIPFLSLFNLTIFPRCLVYVEPVQTAALMVIHSNVLQFARRGTNVYDDFPLA